ncbi:MAG: restriction endonuclease subunit S, partial [Vampirovibrionales bacterium]
MNAHTLNLDLKTNEKKIVLDLLKRYIPHVGVWAYGSRARWNARPDSDLDLVAFANDTDKRAIADLKEAFEESDLPFKVDLFVWAKVPEHFHTTIQKEKVVVQEMLRCTQHDTATPTDTPEGWTHTTLGEVAIISSGKTRPKTKGDYPVYGGNGILDYSDNFNYQDETIIVGRVGAYCGCVYFEKKKFWLSDNALAIKSDNKNAMCFLYYLLLFEKLNQKAIGGAQPLLTQGILNSLPILLPPLPEQEAIAEVLGVLDDKIELNRRMNDTLEAIAKALFKSWFIDFDPVHRNIARSRHSECNEESPTGGRGILRSAQDDNVTQDDEAFTAFDHLFPASFEDSPLGPIPSGWSVGTLGQFVEIKKGKMITKKTVSEGSVPVIAAGISPAYYHNMPNTTAPSITISASGANAGYVNLWHIPIWASDCSVISQQETLYLYFTYLFLNTNRKQITDMQTGCAQPHVYPSDLERLDIISGSTNLLEEFERLVASSFQKIA